MERLESFDPTIKDLVLKMLNQTSKILTFLCEPRLEAPTFGRVLCVENALQVVGDPLNAILHMEHVKIKQQAEFFPA